MTVKFTLEVDQDVFDKIFDSMFNKKSTVDLQELFKDKKAYCNEITRKPGLIFGDGQRPIGFTGKLGSGECTLIITN